MSLKRSHDVNLIVASDLSAFSRVMVIVVFTVLACCMTTLGDRHSGNYVNLPRVLHPVSIGGLTWGANRDDAMIIAVARNGDIFMKNERVDASTLAANIHQSINEGAEPKVYVRADALARYRSVKPVIEAVKSNGVKDVAFFADQREVAR